MEKQTLRDKLVEILKDVPEDETKEILDNVCNALTRTSNQTYNDKNTL